MAIRKFQMFVLLYCCAAAAVERPISDRCGRILRETANRVPLITDPAEISRLLQSDEAQASEDILFEPLAPKTGGFSLIGSLMQPIRSLGDAWEGVIESPKPVLAYRTFGQSRQSQSWEEPYRDLKEQLLDPPSGFHVALANGEEAIDRLLNALRQALNAQHWEGNELENAKEHEPLARYVRPTTLAAASSWAALGLGVLTTGAGAYLFPNKPEVFGLIPASWLTGEWGKYLLSEKVTAHILGVFIERSLTLLRRGGDFSDFTYVRFPYKDEHGLDKLLEIHLIYDYLERHTRLILTTRDVSI